MGNWRALQGLPNQESVKRLLQRVVNRMISLDSMYHEGEKIKKVVKVRNTFLQLLGQKDWKTCREMFPKDTEGEVLAYWAETLAVEVNLSFPLPLHTLKIVIARAIPVSDFTFQCCLFVIGMTVLRLVSLLAFTWKGMELARLVSFHTFTRMESGYQDLSR